LIALALGAAPIAAVVLTAALIGRSNADLIFVLFVPAMAVGSIIAASFALHAALATGLPLNHGPWKSRAWICALLTGVDAFATNIFLAGALIILVTFIAAFTHRGV